MDKKVLLLWMCVLTSLAGAINAISVFAYFGVTVSHLTGLVSKFAICISFGTFDDGFQIFLVILMFFIGAIISGFVTGERAFYLHKRYGFIILAIGLLLIPGVWLIKKYAIFLFAFLMGLQNGMVVSFKGVVVRMTHMSGNITDLGVFIGYKLRKNKEEKLPTGLIPMFAIISFTIGGILGILLFNAIDTKTFFILASIYIILGVLYFVLREKCNDRNFNGIPDELE